MHYENSKTESIANPKQHNSAQVHRFWYTLEVKFVLIFYYNLTCCNKMSEWQNNETSHIKYA